MKQITLLLFLSIAFLSCKPPKDKQFDPKVLAAPMMDDKGAEFTFQQVLDQYKGETVLIDVWASWCADCIQGLPKLKEVQKKYPNIDYVFISLDKDQRSWKNGIKRFSIKGNHYYVNGGWKSIFAKNIDLDWIPRYIVVDATGKVVLYRAIHADDENIIKLLDKPNN
ncbi:TlpA disulfide reductase family protein [Wenyingzhuangia sp. 1_MG-2023]|nr:TlpA disulfide reductase family protein [Wenyingzhuangia sp. 1_MG-2023]